MKTRDCSLTHNNQSIIRKRHISREIAKVVPLFKKMTPLLSITIDPFHFSMAFLKYLKKVIHQQLNSYLLQNNLLNGSQYGFRSNHSTELAVLELVYRISGAIQWIVSKLRQPFFRFI